MDTPSGDSTFIRTNLHQSFLSAAEEEDEEEDTSHYQQSIQMDISPFELNRGGSSGWDRVGRRGGGREEDEVGDEEGERERGGSMFLESGLRRSTRLMRQGGRDSLMTNSDARGGEGVGVGGMEYYLQQTSMSSEISTAMVAPPSAPASSSMGGNSRRTYARRTRTTAPADPIPVPSAAATRRPRPSSSRSESPTATTIRAAGYNNDSAIAASGVSLISTGGPGGTRGAGGRGGGGGGRHPMEMMWSATQQSVRSEMDDHDDSRSGMMMMGGIGGLNMSMSGMSASGMGMSMSMSRGGLDDDMIRQHMRGEGGAGGGRGRQYAVPQRHATTTATAGAGSGSTRRVLLGSGSDDDDSVGFLRRRPAMRSLSDGQEGEGDETEEEEQEEEEEVEGDEGDEEFQLYSTLRTAFSGDRSGTTTSRLNRGLFASSGEGLLTSSLTSGSSTAINNAAARAQVKESLSNWHAAFETANAELVLVRISEASSARTLSYLNEGIRELDVMYNPVSTTTGATTAAGARSGRRARRNTTNRSGSDTDEQSIEEEEGEDEPGESEAKQRDESGMNVNIMGNTISSLKQKNIDLSDPSYILQVELKQLRGLLEEIDETDWMFSNKLF